MLYCTYSVAQFTVLLTIARRHQAATLHADSKNSLLLTNFLQVHKLQINGQACLAQTTLSFRKLWTNTRTESLKQVLIKTHFMQITIIIINLPTSTYISKKNVCRFEEAVHHFIIVT